MLAADGCASSLSNPTCCFCGVWARGGPRGVAVAMFGLSLVWACSSADVRKGTTLVIRVTPRGIRIADDGGPQARTRPLQGSY